MDGLRGRFRVNNDDVDFPFSKLSLQFAHQTDGERGTIGKRFVRLDHKIDISASVLLVSPRAKDGQLCLLAEKAFHGCPDGLDFLF